MAWFALFVLVFWLPAVFFVFEKYPTQKAIVFAFVTGWLFLPPTSIPLSGFPDWTKMSATVFSVFLCTWLRQPQRYFAIRLRWFDLPVLIFSFTPMVSSIQNNLGAYDGFSAVLEELFRWLLPYAIGRAFLADASGNRQLCYGIAVGGLLYMPLCLFEIRMSPVLKLLVFGFGEPRAIDFGLRYGGYRPMVFLSTGLELGWWMCCSVFACYLLWISGGVKRLWGYPLSILTVCVALVTVACKATGAMVQILIGFLLVHFCKLTKTSFLLWALMAIGPVYCVARPMGLWTGEQIVSYANSIFGVDRGVSLEFRFSEEETLMRSAMARPMFGWGRFGGFNPIGKNGRAAVTDGLWIIVFGYMGYVGLAALNAMLLVPTALFTIRFRPKTWTDPDVAPVTTLAIILPLFMLDNLSNAMLNPIYALAMGSVAGYIPDPRRTARRSASGGSTHLEFALAGDPALMGSDFNHAEAPPDALADDYEAMAHSAFEANDRRSANSFFQTAIHHRQQAEAESRNPLRTEQLGRSYMAYARFLTTVGQTRLAIEERTQAWQLWSAFSTRHPGAPVSKADQADNANDLAWLLISTEERGSDSLEWAVTLAEEAVQLTPEHAPYWNTLGIARYRTQDHYKAIHALSRSISLSAEGGTAFDYYYLALANQALGYQGLADDWLHRAESWSQLHPEFAASLGPIHREAREHFPRV